MNSVWPPVVFRLAFAAASMGAMLFQLFTVHIPRGFSVFDFFTYFTNQANILISVVFVVSAIRLIRGRRATAEETAFRGAAVVYIAFVGLVFNTLLRDVDLSNIVPWVNVVMHMVLPVAALVDWLAWPPQNRISARVIPWWMIYPAVYAVASVVRGAFFDVYPYPFFDPDSVGGYGTVLLYCLGMVVGFVVLAFAVRALGNWRARPAIPGR